MLSVISVGNSGSAARGHRHAHRPRGIPAQRRDPLRELVDPLGRPRLGDLVEQLVQLPEIRALDVPVRPASPGSMRSKGVRQVLVQGPGSPWRGPDVGTADARRERTGGSGLGGHWRVSLAGGSFFRDGRLTCHILRWREDVRPVRRRNTSNTRRTNTPNPYPMLTSRSRRASGGAGAMGRT